MEETVRIKQPIQKKTFIEFTLLFIGMVILIYAGFYFTKTSFIWNGDGVSQHFLLFQDYIGKLRGLFNGKGFPKWDWSIGMGADVIQSYGYYVIGDPFVYGGLLFPKAFIELAYHVLILLRLLCIGISFLFYARKMKLSHQGGLLGAGMYAFTHYAMMNVIRHPFFMLPMIWFPLLCLGIEKILKKESAWLFSIMISLSAFSNFYFFYKLTLLSILYAGIRLYQRSDKKDKKIFYQILLKGIGSYLIGILMAGVLFLPMVASFLGSSRGSGEPLSIKLLYPLHYYPNLIKHFLTPGSFLWTVGGFSVFSLFALPVIWKQKETVRFVPIALTILGTGTLFPFFGSFMNGFSGPYNRYTFVIPFFLALGSAWFFDHRINWTDSQKRVSFWLLSFFTIFLLIAVLVQELQIIALFPILIGWIMWIVLKKEKQNHPSYSLLLIGLVYANMATNSMVYYYPPGKNTISDRIPYGSAEESYKNVFEGLEKYLPPEGTTPYRVGVTSKDTHIKNQFIYLDIMGLNSYLSLTNRALSDFSEGLETSQFQLIQPLRKGFDDRRLANHYLGVKYLLTETENEPYLPYGYQVRHRSRGPRSILLAETKASFPFAYTERKWLSKEDYDLLNPVEKEAFLVEAVTTKESWPEDQVAFYKDRLPVKEFPFIVKGKDHTLIPQPRELQVKEKDTNYQIQIDPSKLWGKDVFLYLNGVSFTPVKNGKENYTATVQLNERTKEVYQGNPLSFSSYFKRKELLFNMGHVSKEEELTNFSLQFDLPGEYHFDDIHLFVLEADEEKDIALAEEKRSNELELSLFEEDKIEGSTTLLEPALLVTGIPYTNGWTASVNGDSVDTIEVNNGFIGIPLSKGESHVSFAYHTPYLKTGFYVSVIGWLLFSVCTVIEMYRGKRGKNETN